MTTTMRFDLPQPDPEQQPFWDGARDGRLLIKRCGDCAAFHFYPRPFCPTCWSTNVEWVQAAGTGTLYTWSEVMVNDLPPFNEQVPYVAAIVQLDEGPRMMTKIVEAEASALEMDQRVSVRFVALSDDITIPVFSPAA